MARLFIFLFLLSNTALAYNRADYKHWIDADKDCQNTRQEVLIEESISPLVLNKKGCKVLKGAWMDYYTKKIITNPTKLDIDHLVPLAEVDRSGGNKWSKKKKMQYANDLTNHEALIAVSSSANRSKGDKDPSDWMPPNKDYWCEYIRDWQIVKKLWALNMDEKEKRFIDIKNKECK
jgi:hypothetical protein